MISLNQNIICIFKKQNSAIVILDITDDSDISFTIESSLYAEQIHELFSKKINYYEFVSSLSNKASMEFSLIIEELGKFGFIEDRTKKFEYQVGRILNGEYFLLTAENIAHDVYAPTYSEGEACSPQGATYCETNSGNASFPRELWQCISGPPDNWAAMGQSC